MLVKNPSKASDNYLAKLLEEYRSTHGELPCNMDFVSEWALNNNRIQPSRRSAIKDISRQLSRAARHQLHRDPQGRRVRTYHAARYQRLTKNGQIVFETMWDHLETMGAEHWRISSGQRWSQIEGECKSLKRDEDSFLDNNPNAVGYESNLSFDFEPFLDEGAPVHTESLDASGVTDALIRKKGK